MDSVRMMWRAMEWIECGVLVVGVGVGGDEIDEREADAGDCDCDIDEGFDDKSLLILFTSMSFLCICCSC
jgi:hypothetical protein